MTRIFETCNFAYIKGLENIHKNFKHFEEKVLTPTYN